MLLSQLRPAGSRCQDREAQEMYWGADEKGEKKDEWLIWASGCSTPRGYQAFSLGLWLGSLLRVLPDIHPNQQFLYGEPLSEKWPGRACPLL